MMKRWKLFLFLLAVAILAIAVHLRMVSTWPYPVRTFEEIPLDGWYAPAIACHANEKGEMVYESYGWYAPAIAYHANEKGEMVFESYGAEYRCTSNTVTGVVTIERWRK